MNNEIIEHLIATNPTLRDSREKLEAMQDGAYCMHRAWGFGQIKRYDPATNRLIIDFPECTKMEHPMAPEFCVNKLEILPADNVLVRQKTEPEIIAHLVKNDPAELVKQALRSDVKQSMSGIELEGLFSRLLGQVKGKKWWAATKRLLVQDSDIAVPDKKDGQYILREDPLKPEQEILEKYHLHKNPRQKILLAEKLFELCTNDFSRGTHGRDGRYDFIMDDLSHIFDELTVAIKGAKRLSKAECLHGIWVRNDLCRHLKENVDQLEPTSSSIITSCSKEELSALAAQIPQTPAYLKRILDLITRIYPRINQWEDIIIDLLRNSSGKFTTECVNFLIERDRTDLVAQNMLEWLNAQALKSPVLSWVIRNRNSKKYACIVRPLIGHSLLAAILYAIDNEALQASSTRRIPLAEELSDDKDLIPDLLEEAGYEIARDLAQSLLLNQGFEPLTKKSILARFIKLHPKIQSLVAGESAGRVEQTLVVSQWSLDTRKRELEDIIKNKIPENKKAIAIAKEHGDLSENSEYKMARQDQETLLSRKSQLENDLITGRVTDFSEAATDTIGIGSIVELQGNAGTVRYTVLGAWDSAPEDNILSYKTPLAQKLLGKKVGEIIQTEMDDAVTTWTIRHISRWVDQQK